MNRILQQAYITAVEINNDNKVIIGPPEEGISVYDGHIVSRNIIRGTRGYIERIGNQINGTYQNGWFDASAVLIRRLIETLIIEVYEQYGMQDSIKDQNGDYLFLGDLIDKILNEPSWTIGRTTRKALPKLKDIGNKSAHSRRFIAQRDDIDSMIGPLRDTIQELIYLAKLK